MASNKTFGKPSYNDDNMNTSEDLIKLKGFF